MPPVERKSSVIEDSIEKMQQQSISDYTNNNKNGGDARSTSNSSTAGRRSSNIGCCILPRRNSVGMVILIVIIGQILIVGIQVNMITDMDMFGSASKKQMVLERHQNDQQRQQQVPRSYPAHIPSFPPDIIEIIKTTNSSDYTWLGNHFMPPPGLPIFTPSQIRTYFQQRNVLMLGDSTNRRARGTLRAILNAEDLDDVKVAELEEVQRRRRLANTRSLQENRLNPINTAAADAKYKAAASKTISDCGPRNNRNRLKIPRQIRLFSCDNVIGSSAEKYAAVTNSDVDNQTSIQHEAMKQRKGFFDHGMANCFHTIVWYFTPEDKNGRLVNLEDYDLVIINIGIWEDLKKGDCRRNLTSNLGLLPEVLERIRDESSKDLQVVLRTSGFALQQKNGQKEKVRPDLIWNFTNYSKQYFDNISMTQDQNKKNKTSNGDDHAPNMTLVDYSTVISKRSFGEQRINGDHVAHYGYEARLLYVQQLMHELIKAELEK